MKKTSDGSTKSYIFDIDGTLLDSMGLWADVDASFLRKRNIAEAPDYSKAIISMNLGEAAIYTIERFGLRENADDIVREWKAMAASAYESSIEMKPYAKEYLDAIRTRGLKMAVATSLPAELYTPALSAHGLMGYFTAVCSTEDVKRGKTHPDVYLYAAEKLGAALPDCIVFEDILTAVRSAKRAGTTVYAMYDAASAADWPQMAKEADGAFYDFNSAPQP